VRSMTASDRCASVWPENKAIDMPQKRRNPSQRPKEFFSMRARAGVGVALRVVAVVPDVAGGERSPSRPGRRSWCTGTASVGLVPHVATQHHVGAEQAHLLVGVWRKPSIAQPGLCVDDDAVHQRAGGRIEVRPVSSVVSSCHSTTHAPSSATPSWWLSYQDDWLFADSSMSTSAPSIHWCCGVEAAVAHRLPLVLLAGDDAGAGHAAHRHVEAVVAAALVGAVDVERRALESAVRAVELHPRVGVVPVLVEQREVARVVDGGVAHVVAARALGASRRRASRRCSHRRRPGRGRCRVS
jgi:hypothetical protein